MGSNGTFMLTAIRSWKTAELDRLWIVGTAPTASACEFVCDSLRLIYGIIVLSPNGVLISGLAKAIGVVIVTLFKFPSVPMNFLCLEGVEIVAMGSA